MTNREAAVRRSQNPSSHQSIEDAPPMMRRMVGSALLPNVWTQRSTPFARMILSLGSIGRISGPGVGGCSGAWPLSVFVMTGRSLNAWCELRSPSQQVGEGQPGATEPIVEPDAEVVQRYPRRKTSPQTLKLVGPF